MLADNDTEREIGDLIFRSISTRGGPHRPQLSVHNRLFQIKIKHDGPNTKRINTKHYGPNIPKLQKIHTNNP